MKYDFDTVIDRRNTLSCKWDVAENELPMWVADMDFKAAPAILSSLEKTLEHGVFGYSVMPDTWYEAYINWWKSRHGFEMKKEWLMFTTGVVPAIASVIRKLTNPGDNIVIQAPVYNVFYYSISENARQVLEAKLIYDNGEYSIDWCDLESKLADPKTSMMIFCNPHNPIGKIWDRETIAKIGELCKKHDVIVISDEIHCDLTDPGEEYIPYASVSEICRENCIICIAPTKTFNIAGIKSAAVAVPNEELRQKVLTAVSLDGIGGANAFAANATAAAFSESGEWLDELREYIYVNKKFTEEFLRKEVPCVRLVPSKATYLLWLDISAFCENSEDFASFLREKTGLFILPGNKYGSGGEHFLRVNIACPRALLEDGLSRLKDGVEAYIGK